jgi:hypothetical protein
MDDARIKSGDLFSSYGTLPKGLAYSTCLSSVSLGETKRIPPAWGCLQYLHLVFPKSFVMAGITGMA